MRMRKVDWAMWNGDDWALPSLFPPSPPHFHLFIDVGAPQLSMHSIREVAGTDDVGHSIDLFTAFFRDFTHYNKGIWVD